MPVSERAKWLTRDKSDESVECWTGDEEDGVGLDDGSRSDDGCRCICDCVTLASGFAPPFAAVPSSHSFSVRPPVCGSQPVPTCLHPPTLAGRLRSHVGDNQHNLVRVMLLSVEVISAMSVLVAAIAVPGVLHSSDKNNWRTKNLHLLPTKKWWKTIMVTIVEINRGV